MKFFRFFAWFLLFYILLSFFFPKTPPASFEDISIQIPEKITQGNDLLFSLQNTTTNPFTLSYPCNTGFVFFEKYENGIYTSLYEGENSQEQCQEILHPEETRKLSAYSDFSLSFKEESLVRVSVQTEDGKQFSKLLNVTPPGFFKNLWIILLYQPIYNLLIYLVSILPVQSLGLAIILLTVLMRIVLLLPNAQALKSQKKLQELQPKLDEVKQKYANDQQKLAEETLKVWKENKVNPLGSCLPLLLQMPVLIAVFFILKAGITEGSAQYLYPVLASFDFSSVEYWFLFFDLRESAPIILAILVAGTQFIQMKMSFKKQQNKDALGQQMQTMNTMFTYMLPVMIGGATLSFPAGVGIYWWVSTLFGVAQQYFIQKKK
jgi:YidC/Oxa1 family membrane protein insertase